MQSRAPCHPTTHPDIVCAYIQSIIHYVKSLCVFSHALIKCKEISTSITPNELLSCNDFACSEDVMLSSSYLYRATLGHLLKTKMISVDICGFLPCTNCQPVVTIFPCFLFSATAHGASEHAGDEFNGFFTQRVCS